MAIDEDQVRNGVASVAALAAVTATKPLVERTWKTVARRDVPADPSRRDVPWGEALAWALVTGALIGVIRLVAQRGVVAAWARARGDAT